MKRRDLLASLGVAAVAAPQSSPPADPVTRGPKQELPIEQYQPRSMLHTKETQVPRAAFPVIDVHTHITHAGGLNGPGTLHFAASPEECLAVMDRKNIQTLVNLTSGYGDNLQQAIDKMQKAHPAAFWSSPNRPGAKPQIAITRKCKPISSPMPTAAAHVV